MVYKYVGCTSRSAVRHDGNQVKDLKAGNGQHNAYEKRSRCQHRQRDISEPLKCIGAVYLCCLIKLSWNRLQTG